MSRARTHGKHVLRSIVLAAALAVALPLQACDSAWAGSAVNSRFFGIHAPDLPDAFPSVPRGAVDLTTNEVYWPQLEPTQGTFDFTHLDAVLQAAEQHHAKPLLVLGRTPSWVGSDPTAPPAMGAWQDYVRAVVQQYGTRLDYQVWPEPNIIENWSGSPQQLARLTAAAAKIIHHEAPKALVVGPAMVLRMGYQRKFMDRFYASRVDGRRVGSFLDVVGIDGYPQVNGTPEDSFAIIHEARSILRSHKVKAPMWNLEMNYGVVGGHAGAGRWSNSKQASYVVRNDVLDAAAGIKRVYWLGWFPFKEGTIQLVKANGTTPTVAAKALDVVRGWLLNQRVGSCGHKKHSSLWTCKTVHGGKASWIYWTTKGKAVVHAPRGSRHVATATGAVRRTHAGKRVRVTGSPVRIYH